MPTATLPKHYEDLCALRREGATLSSVAALASWDQETYMPPGAAAARASQLGLLARLIHERETSPELGETLGLCESDSSLTADDRIGASLREMRRDYDRLTKLPADLVESIATTCSQAMEAWKGARKNNDFETFAPWLDRVVTLMRRKAECVGAPDGGELYDALLDEYEPGARAAMIESVFSPLRAQLAAFIKEVADNGTPPSDAPLRIHAPTAAQHELGLRALRAIGFDLDTGRLDVTTHPFCEGVAPGDTRLTTRYREDHFTDALYGTLHEGGHGLYDQGLPQTPDLFGTPLAEDAGLGIHESQSRMWENFVGRSRAFWRWMRPIANELFAGALDAFSVDDMTRAVNTCKPSLIRVEADEGTYNLHVMLRFELERGLISGDLGVRDVPGAWNERMKSMLGLDVPDNARGCLQDVHWSAGLLGYFPTYTLGNLYAAQLWEKINADLPALDASFARGEFADLLAWLRQHVHAHGRRYPAPELLERATGRPLEAAPLMRHLESRIRPAYAM